MSTIHLAFLGTPQLQRDGQPLDFHIAKVQALLAYLAATRRAQSRDHLLGLLWTESHADAARKNLRNRLWQLRQSLGDEAIITDGDMLALSPTVWSDVATFVTGIEQQLQRGTPDAQTLEELLDLWRGPLLDGVVLHEAPEFEIWLANERAHLGQLYLQALSTLLSSKRQASDWPGVIGLAQRGLHYDSLHEPLHQQLIVAYTQQGLRAEALRQYDQLKNLLATELNVAPLPATQALHAALINHNGAPTSERAQPTPTAAHIQPNGMTPTTINHQLTVPPHTATLKPFIGRQAELAALDRARVAAQQGQARVVLLSGELGMGKTTLWQQWIAGFTPTPVVLATRALNTTQQLPFEPMRRLLGTLPCRAQLRQIADQLLPVWCAELRRLAPNLQDVLPPTTAVAVEITLSPLEERGLIAEALTQFLRAFAGNPLILFIDDLHWADGATLDWLLYLTDRMIAEPLLLVGAYRAQDVTPPLARLIAQWQRDGLLQRIDLPSFTSAETTTLLTALGSNAPMAEYLHLQSGGNPYYLTQLSDIAIDGVPATLAELVQARLSYLAESWQPVLQAAAILEPTIEVSLLVQTSDRSEESTVDALDGLLRAGIMVERGEGYEFAHGLVATVVREGLSSGRRKLLHRRAAEGLLARHQPSLMPVTGQVAGQLAYHYGAAGAKQEAARFAELAGAEALRIGAAQEAVTFYEQAQSLHPTPDRQLGLGMALMLLPGKIAAARTGMEAALSGYEALGDAQGAIRAGLRLATSYLGTQEGAQVLRWARRVLPDLEVVEDPTLHASAHYLMGTAKFRNGYDLSEAEQHYIEATRLVTEYALDSEIALMSWFEWGNLCLERGDYAQALDKFRQAQQVAKSGKSILFEALSLNNLAYATLLTGAVANAQRLIDEALNLAQTYALRPMYYYLLSTRGEIALASGELATAKVSFSEAIALAEKYENHTFVANLQAHLGRVAQAQGDLVEAERLLSTAKAVVETENIRHLQIQIDLWLAALALQQAAPEIAAQQLHMAEERLITTDYRQLKATAAQLHAQLLQP